MAFYKNIQKNIQDGMEELGRQTIESFNKKCQNLKTILYKLNKFTVKVDAESIDLNQLFENFKTI